MAPLFALAVVPRALVCNESHLDLIILKHFLRFDREQEERASQYEGF
jgi:hypothetical protein